jgi:hypothetical protein
MHTTFPMIALLAVIGLAACGKTEAPATPSTTPTATTASTNGTGVAECDDYLARYEACLADKVPESARAMLRQSLDATRASWNQVLATPGGKDALKTSCVAARDATRMSLQAYGCTDF